MSNITAKNYSSTSNTLPIEIFFSSNQKITLSTENSSILLKDSTGKKFFLPLDPLGISYLFKMCLLVIKNQGINFFDSLNKDFISNSDSSYEKPIIAECSSKNETDSSIPSLDPQFKKDSITYDRIFEIIMNKEFIDPNKYLLNLRDEEWREVLLEAFQGHKTYSSGVIARLKELGLPIDDFQVGRVLKNMRIEGYIRGTEKISKKTNKFYYLLEFPPYQDFEEKNIE